MVSSNEALPVCPNCHGETTRLTYCSQSRRLLCIDCALTDADLFFLELICREDMLDKAAAA